jgi:hypothetical protein
MDRICSRWKIARLRLPEAEAGPAGQVQDGAVDGEPDGDRSRRRLVLRPGGAGGGEKSAHEDGP